MRKQILHQGTEGNSPADYQDWLDVEQWVRVELTSNDVEHPIESVEDELVRRLRSCGPPDR